MCNVMEDWKTGLCGAVGGGAVRDEEEEEEEEEGEGINTVIVSEWEGARGGEEQRNDSSL